MDNLLSVTIIIHKCPCTLLYRNLIYLNFINSRRKYNFPTQTLQQGDVFQKTVTSIWVCVTTVVRMSMYFTRLYLTTMFFWAIICLEMSRRIIDHEYGHSEMVRLQNREFVHQNTLIMKLNTLHTYLHYICIYVHFATEFPLIYLYQMALVC